jgi:hypothetical protein
MWPTVSWASSLAYQAAGAVWANDYGQAVTKQALDGATGGWSGFVFDLVAAVWEDGFSPSVNPYFVDHGFDDAYSPRTLAFFNAYRLRAAKSFVGSLPMGEVALSAAKANQVFQAGKSYMAIAAMARKLNDRSGLKERLQQVMTIKQRQAALAGLTLASGLAADGRMGDRFVNLGRVAGVRAEVASGRAGDFYGPVIADLSHWLHWRAFTELRVGHGRASGPALRICRELAKGSLGYDALGIDNFIPEPKGHWVIAHNLNEF